MSSNSDFSDGPYGAGARPRFASDRLATARAVVESQDQLQTLRGRHEQVARECEVLRRREKELSYAARKLESELEDARAQLADQRAMRVGAHSDRASLLPDKLTAPEHRSAHAIRRTRAASTGRVSTPAARDTPLSASRTPRSRLTVQTAAAAGRFSSAPSPRLASGREADELEQLREQLEQSERRFQQQAIESVARDAEQRTRIASLERLCERLSREDEERRTTHDHSARALDKLAAQLFKSEQRKAQLEVELAQRDAQLERLTREHATQHDELRQALRALALGSSSLAPRVAAWPTPRSEQRPSRVEAAGGVAAHAARRPPTHRNGAATRESDGGRRHASRQVAADTSDLSPESTPASGRYDAEGVRYAARPTARPASASSSASSEPRAAAQRARLEEMKAIDQEVDNLHRALELTTRRLAGLPAS